MATQKVVGIDFNRYCSCCGKPGVPEHHRYLCMACYENPPIDEMEHCFHDLKGKDRDPWRGRMGKRDQMKFFACPFINL